MKLHKTVVMFCWTLLWACFAVEATAGAAEARKSEFPKVIAKLDETNAEYFVSMTLLRQRALQDSEVLARLSWEKKIAYSNVNAKLVKEYKILARQQYVWDKEDLTIYQLLDEKTWKGQNKRLKHLKFKSEEEAKPAIALLQQRIRASVQVQVVEGLSAERAQLAREADRAIRKKFKLEDKGNYTFDVEKRAIVQTGVKEPKK